jgi:assimilatory nitrate reductase catalytic subunit
MHPEDVRSLGLSARAIVRIRSRRAAITARLVPSHTVQRGQVFLPMHYDTVNRLTLNSVDPLSRQPNYKHCAVRVEPLNPGTPLPHHDD